MGDVWVLVKTVERPEVQVGDARVVGVYQTRAALDERVKRMASRNEQYPMRALGKDAWVIGPEDDEGFFGNKPVYLHAQSTPHHDFPDEGREQ